MCYYICDLQRLGWIVTSIVMNAFSLRPDPPRNDRRRETRSKTIRSGKLTYGGFSKTVIDCLVVEVSNRGARIETGVMINVPETVFLNLNGNIVQQMRRCWAIGNQVGLEAMPITA